MIYHNDPQGSPEWLESRRGVITASRFKDCRDKLKNGEPSKKCLAYAMDLARERIGGKAPDTFQTFAMRQGTEQEPIARARYEAITGNLVEEVGFITTDDGLFGVSVDGLIDADGVAEIKCMVSSDTLFTAMVRGDLDEYRDQCNGALWLLGRKWVDLILWAPDLDRLVIKRIERNEVDIEALENDLMKFAELAASLETEIAELAAA
jgi:exodeoxyribonuclease (lambda-induced)